jgi:hypothetical protein
MHVAPQKKKRGTIRTSEQSVRTTAPNAEDIVDNSAQLTQKSRKSEKDCVLESHRKKKRITTQHFEDAGGKLKKRKKKSRLLQPVGPPKWGLGNSAIVPLEGVGLWDWSAAVPAATRTQSLRLVSTYG